MQRSVLVVILSFGCCSLLTTTTISALTITSDGFYDTRYNHLDVEKLLNNKRLVTYYAMCLIGKGTCTPQGTEFKRILPEALKTNCARCTEKQQVTAYLAIRRLKKEYPKIWAQLQNEWDPTGEYVSTFINTVEKKPKQKQQITPLQSSSSSATVNVETKLENRFGDADNEINGSILINQQQMVTNKMTTIPTTTTTSSSISSSSTTTTTTTERVTTNQIPTSTTLNYRTTSRTHRFTIRLPRPGELGLRITTNLVNSIGDIGTKMFKTGARIADIVLSSVQATINDI